MCTASIFKKEYTTTLGIWSYYCKKKERQSYKKDFFYVINR